jgi:hypothetical protein
MITSRNMHLYAGIKKGKRIALIGNEEMSITINAKWKEMQGGPRALKARKKKWKKKVLKKT